MRQPKAFRVLAVQSDGNEILVSSHRTREGADRVVELITPGTLYTQIRIEEKAVRFPHVTKVS